MTMSDDAGSTPPLKAIGYWLGTGESDFPDPHDFVDPTWNAREREVVARYLDRGWVLTVALGYSGCRFCQEYNDSAELTDGTFVWPEGLAHYLREHEVRLPQPIVEHVLAQRPDVDPRAEVDEEWWKTFRKT